MLNGWCLLIVAGVLVMQQIDVTTAAYTMEETCKYIKGGWIADPTDCQSYGYCENLQLKGKQKCPTGAYYNPDKGVCSYQKACRLNVESMCNGATQPTFYPNPNNCTQYFYCNTGEKEVLSCPKDQIFDVVNTRCTYPKKGACVTDSICRLVQDNVFAADPTKCGNYVSCQKGTGVSKSCPLQAGAQLFFSQITNECQSTKFCVDNDAGNTNDGEQTPKKPDGSKCTDTVKFISDETTCYGYFKCTGAGEVGDWMKCPPKTHFHPTDQQCVSPYTYACTKDRCGNMDAVFMGAATPNDCKNYLNCKNNAYISASTDTTFKGQPCAKGYFNEFTQQCTATNPASNPDYKLCPNVPATDP